MATPMTTPHCMLLLQALARGEDSATAAAAAAPPHPDDRDVEALNAHMQRMSGAASDPRNPPVFATSGLAALAALWMSILEQV